MGIWTFVLTAYVAVTVFALYMTYQEQRRHNRRSFTFNLIRYALCVVWPLLIAGLAVLARFRPASFYRAEFDRG